MVREEFKGVHFELKVGECILKFSNDIFGANVIKFATALKVDAVVVA